MLSLQRVQVAVPEKILVDDINLDILPGEVIALVGPNGAGKSTLMKAITGEHRLTGGTITFHGQNMGAWDGAARARHLAVLPQQSTLQFPFTGREVVALSRTPHNSGSNTDAQIIHDALVSFDSLHLADEIYTQLSGGEQKRIQLARVFAQLWQPVDKERCLLLDEPTASLDLAHQQLLVSQLRGFVASGASVIIVLHDLNLAMRCADRIAVLAEGRLTACGDPDNVLTESLLQDVFRVRARLLTDPASGYPVLSFPPEEFVPTSSTSS